MQLPTPSVASSSANLWFMNNYAEIQSRSKACFCRLTPDRRQEAEAEVLATVFKATASAAKRGTLNRLTPFHLVSYAVQQQRVGRRMAGSSSTDVLSDLTRIKRGTRVISLSQPAMGSDNYEGHRSSLAEMLSDRRVDRSPFEQVRQNLDYPEILKREQVSKKAKEVFRLLAVVRGRGQNQTIARMLRVSPGRICQLKGKLAKALAKHQYGPASGTPA